MNCGLTHSGRLVDHLPYSYGWIDDVYDWFACFGELLEDSLDATPFTVF